MGEIDTEKWQHKIRNLCEGIQKAEYELHWNEAELKRMIAKKKIKALAEGHKTVSAQECYSDSDDEVFTQRLRVGESKGILSALRVQIKSYEIGFETWRTIQANNRSEYKRYGN